MRRKMNIQQIPIDKLLQDRADCLSDISICNWALLLDVTEYSGGSVQRRLEVNQEIVAKIEAELWRRKQVED